MPSLGTRDQRNYDMTDPKHAAKDNDDLSALANVNVPRSALGPLRDLKHLRGVERTVNL